LNRELVSALARQLGFLASVAILEVCAGDGRLAAELGSLGVDVRPTDVVRRPDGYVRALAAKEALAADQPSVVLGSFVPSGAGVDRAVMTAPSVRFYVVLNARIGGVYGGRALWDMPGWDAHRLPDVTKWMITRHDVWLGEPGRPLIQHGEAWILKRD
jgi:hypothetical protein